MCWVTQSCLTLCGLLDYSPPGSSIHGDSPGKNTGGGCHALLQGISPTQELNQGLQHCRQTLYQLSYQGSSKLTNSITLSIPFLFHIIFTTNVSNLPPLTSGLLHSAFCYQPVKELIVYRHFSSNSCSSTLSPRSTQRPKEPSLQKKDTLNPSGSGSLSKCC